MRRAASAVGSRMRSAARALPFTWREEPGCGSRRERPPCCRGGIRESVHASGYRAPRRKRGLNRRRWLFLRSHRLRLRSGRLRLCFPCLNNTRKYTNSKGAGAKKIGRMKRGAIRARSFRPAVGPSIRIGCGPEFDCSTAANPISAIHATCSRVGWERLLGRTTGRRHDRDGFASLRDG